jgi:hypothetical protein
MKELMMRAAGSEPPQPLHCTTCVLFQQLKARRCGSRRQKDKGGNEREEASETCDSHVRQMRELGNKTEVLVDALTH